jgi:hypothetical protein
MSRIQGRLPVVQRLAALQRAGCSVDVLYADMGSRDHRILKTAGVGLQRFCLASDHLTRGTPYAYEHSKYLMIEGTTNNVGVDRRIVFTGSENLDDLALGHTDDRLVRYVETADDDPIFTTYQLNFSLGRQIVGESLQSTGNCSGDD